MADLERTVAIIFEGVDGMGAGVDSATKKIDALGKNIENIAAPLASGTKALLAFEAAALTVAFAMGTRAYDAAVAFEAAQADLAKTLGDNEGSVDQFTREITNLSNIYGESSTDLLASMANYKQAGFTAEESLGLVKSGLDLVIAGDLEAAQASEVLVASLKGFQVPASEAGNLLEVLNASSNKYATNVEELSQGMARLSPISSTLGLSFEESAELLIPIIEVFRSGSEAANALRTGLLRLGDDSAPVVSALESIGVAQRDANGDLRNSQDILQDVAEATLNMTDADKLFIAQQLFGIEQSAKMVTVLDAVANSSIDVSAAMKETASVTEEVEIRLNSAQKAGERASESFENLSRTLGLQFLDEMKGINTAIAEIFIQFEQAAAGGALDEFFDAVNPMFDEIRRLAEEVAQALPDALEGADYSGFSDGLLAIFGNLEDVTITAEDLIAVIEGTGSAFQSLSEFTAGTIEVFKGIAAALSPVIEAFLSLDSDTQKFIGTIGGISLVVSPAVGVIGGLTKAIAALAGANGIIGIALPNIKTLGAALGKNTGLAAVAFLAGETIWEMHQRLKAFNEEPIQLAEKLRKDLEDVENIEGDEFSLFNVENIAASYESLRQYFGWGDEAAEDFKIVNDEAILAAIAVADLGDGAGQAGTSLQGMGDAADDSADKVKVIKQAAIDAALQIADLGTGEKDIQKLDTAAVDAALAVASIGENGKSINVLSADINDTSKFVVGLDGELIDVNKSITTLGTVSEETSKKVKDSAGELTEFEKVAMELASNEKIKAMEFTAEINIAALEADARKVEAILTATSDTIASMGESVSDLFGIMASEDLSFRQRWDMEDAIDQQLEIQQQAAEDQTKLINAQIDAMRAKTEALRNGDGLVTITSDGLEPALEMIMWQVIEKVQLRANAEGAEFLLGI